MNKKHIQEVEKQINLFVCNVLFPNLLVSMLLNSHTKMLSVNQADDGGPYEY